ncbi:RUS family member 1 [Nilaparvata lugens]|uniref:RUS family member 1 n=1 Tax=Nilaparvata lugens TaxID=108931 RepID=UPI000B98D262|nr:RUS family member 1 [Nilaparvata lugens]
MAYDVVYREKQGPDGQETFYARLPDKYSVMAVSSSNTGERKHTLFYGFKNFFREVFLPQGYPDSVSKDYMNYQIWDSAQAFCSTLSGTLATQSIMKGVGVGSSTATPLSAAVTWILKDGTGMVGRILFAWWKGTSLDCDCKKWRLFADVLNDLALSVEMFLLPLAPSYSLQILCLSSTLKAIVGVAGGATRAVNTQHQALCNNIADVSAKDGSQETCLNLIGSVFGILVLSLVGESEVLMRLLFIFFLIGHVYSNYMAVRALQFSTLNKERYLIILKTYLSRGLIRRTEHVNYEESVVVGSGITEKQLCGYEIYMGCSLKYLVDNHLISAPELQLYSHLSEKRKYLVIISIKSKKIFVPLHSEHSSLDAICAYFHAILLAIATNILFNGHLGILNQKRNEQSLLTNLEYEIKSNRGTIEDYSGDYSALRRKQFPLEAITCIGSLLDMEFQQFILQLHGNGWRTDFHHLPVGMWRSTWNVREYDNN